MIVEVIYILPFPIEPFLFALLKRNVFHHHNNKILKMHLVIHIHSDFYTETIRKRKKEMVILMLEKFKLEFVYQTLIQRMDVVQKICMR